MLGKPPWARKGFKKKEPKAPKEKLTTEKKQDLKGGGLAGMRRFNRGGKV